MTNRIIDELKKVAKLNEQAAMVSNKSNEMAAAITMQAQRAMKQLEQVVIAHPVASLSVAVAAGLAFGWWVKRK